MPSMGLETVKDGVGRTGKCSLGLEKPLWGLRAEAGIDLSHKEHLAVGSRTRIDVAKRKILNGVVKGTAQRRKGDICIRRELFPIKEKARVIYIPFLFSASHCGNIANMICLPSACHVNMPEETVRDGLTL